MTGLRHPRVHLPSIPLSQCRSEGGVLDQNRPSSAIITVKAEGGWTLAASSKQSQMRRGKAPRAAGSYHDGRQWLALVGETRTDSSRPAIRCHPDLRYLDKEDTIRMPSRVQGSSRGGVRQLHCSSLDGGDWDAVVGKRMSQAFGRLCFTGFTVLLRAWEYHVYPGPRFTETSRNEL